MPMTGETPLCFFWGESKSGDLQSSIETNGIKDEEERSLNRMLNYGHRPRLYLDMIVGIRQVQNRQICSHRMTQHIADL